MKQKVRIVGGPRDGDLVKHVGPMFREAVPVTTFSIDVEPSQDVAMEERIYDLCSWKTESGDVVPRYVLRGHKLGQEEMR